jgi:hypothetical protein
MTKYLYLSLALLLFSCSSETKELNFKDWIGTWHNTDPQSQFTEEWEQISDTKYKGTGSWYANDSIVYQEQIELIYNESAWKYCVLAPGQNKDEIVEFQLTSFTDSSWTFTNPTHDFPKKILYTLLSPITMKVHVTGHEDGKMKELLFDLKRK